MSIALGKSVYTKIFFIAHELFTQSKSKKGRIRSMAVKFDLEKAYDPLDWNYIKSILSKFDLVLDGLI